VLSESRAGITVKGKRMTNNSYYAAVLTLYDKNYQIDERKMRDYMQFLLGKDIMGFFPAGTSGEYVGHTSAENLQLLKIVIDENDEIVSYGGKLPEEKRTTNKALKYVTMVLHPGVMFYKSDIEEIGGYRNFICAQDYDLWLRLTENGKQIAFINDYLFKYRVSGGNISYTNALKQWCCNKYIRLMAKQRLKNGFDSFSEDNLKKYLEDYQCDNEEVKQQFLKGKILFDEGRALLRKHRYVSSIHCMLKALICHKEIKYMVYNSMMHKVVMKFYK
jgi:hypothetical protein